MPVPSPCVGICVVTADRVCMGCRRTLGEISSWSTASDAWRQEVIERTRQRSGVANNDSVPAPSVGHTPPATRAVDRSTR